MARIARVLVGLVAGYALGAGLGAVLVQLLSGNTHDKSLEMVMTAVFATGPLGAVIGLLAGALWPMRARPARSQQI